jgi:hypothetical protein
MIKVYLVKDKAQYDISDYIVSLKWSGDLDGAARKISVDLLQNDEMKELEMDNGDMLEVIHDGKSIFQGYIFSLEMEGGGTTASYVAYDGLIYLIKSKGTYNFKNMASRQIIDILSEKFGFEVGILPSINTKCSRIFQDKSVYEIIKEVYEIEGKKNNDKYVIEMNNGVLEIFEYGRRYVENTLEDNINLISLKYSESIEDMVSKVMVLDDKDNKIDVLVDSELTDKYGSIQNVYKEEDGIDYRSGAKDKMKGPDKVYSIDALGDIGCTTGKSVYIKDSTTGITGEFYISGDEHSFSSNSHTMSLNLVLKEKEDEK